MEDPYKADDVSCDPYDYKRAEDDPYKYYDINHDSYSSQLQRPQKNTFEAKEADSEIDKLIFSKRFTDKRFDPNCPFLEHSWNTRLGSVTPKSYPDLMPVADDSEQLQNQHMEAIDEFLESAGDAMNIGDMIQFVQTLDKSIGGKIIKTEMLAALRLAMLRLTQPDDHSFYWSRRLLNARQLQKDEERNRRLAQLADDFQTYSTTYAETIVHELGLPVQMKSLHAIDLGGVAGGSKFITCSILFKFSRDVNLGGFHLYGGHEAEHELAMKAAAIELRAAIQCSSQLPENYDVPMQCLVDFQGFRIIAMPVLPISKKTLVYGSADGMKHVKNNPDVHKALLSLADRFHLAEHRLQGYEDDEETILCTGGDVEVHQDGEGFYYVLDLARFFPPMHPQSCYNHAGLPFDERAIFFRTFRPEFLNWLGHKTNLQRLSSDALSNWGRLDDELHANAAMRATDCLLEERVLEFASELDQVEESNLTNLSQRFHRYGINMHLLGAVFSKCTNPNTRRRLLVDMVARALKNLLRRSLRSLQEGQQVWTSPYSVKTELANFLNQLCGTADPAELLRDVSEHIASRFGEFVAGLESLPGMLEVYCEELVPRVCWDCGVELLQETEASFGSIGWGFSFSPNDISRFSPSTRTLTLLTKSKIQTLLHRASQLPRASSADHRLRRSALSLVQLVHNEDCIDVGTGEDLDLRLLSTAVDQMDPFFSRFSSSPAILLDWASRYIDNPKETAGASLLISRCLDVWDEQVFFIISQLLASYSIYYESNFGSWLEIMDQDLASALCARVVSFLDSELSNKMKDLDSECNIEFQLVLLCAIPYIDGFLTQDDKSNLNVLFSGIKSYLEEKTELFKIEFDLITVIMKRINSNICNRIEKEDLSFGATFDKHYLVGFEAPIIGANIVNKIILEKSVFEANQLNYFSLILCSAHCLLTRRSITQSTPIELLLFSMAIEQLSKLIVDDIQEEALSIPSFKSLVPIVALSETENRRTFQPFICALQEELIFPLNLIMNRGHRFYCKVPHRLIEASVIDYGLQNRENGGHFLKYVPTLEDFVGLLCFHNLSDSYELVNYAIKLGRDMEVDMCFWNGTSARDGAIKNANIQLLKLLKKEGASLFHQSRNGDYPIHLAVRMGHFDVLAFILENTSKKIDVLTRSRSSALVLACRSQRMDMMELLLNHGANTELCSKFDDLPLYHAISKNNIVMANMLIDAGCNVHASWTEGAGVGRTDNCTPLRLCAKSSRVEIAKLLIEAKADLDIPAKGETPLMIAVDRNCSELVELLLEAKAQPNFANDKGHTILYKACRKYRNVDMISMLLKHGADPELPNGEYPSVHELAESGELDAEIIKLILPTSQEEGKEEEEAEECIRKVE